jgi:hypothetical protein
VFDLGAAGLGAVPIFTGALPRPGAATGASLVLAGLTVLATTAYSVREMRAETASNSRRARPATGRQKPAHAAIAQAPRAI